jgi:glycosyltransferase involved in cell wall biosynthesis
MVESFISIIAPLEGDEGRAVDAFVEETVAVLRELVSHYEIVLVDDGASEETVARVRALLDQYDFVRFLRLSRHFGEETAIAAGLDVAIGDYMIVMLPNLDPPALIPQFFERARADADIVYGVRLHRKSEPFWYRLGARVFYWYINSVVKAGIPRDSTQYRCMSRQVVNAITQIRSPDRYLRLLTSYVGFRKQGLPYSPINRTGHQTVRPKREAVDLARALIMDHTTHPLRAVTWAIVLVAIGNAIAVGIMLTVRVVEPWLIQGALQFLAIAVGLAFIAEYVGGLSRRMRDRPAYYVREEHTSSVLLKEERKNVVDATSSARP